VKPTAKRSKIIYNFLAVILTLAIIPLVVVVWQLVKISRDSLSYNERNEQIRVVLLVQAELQNYITGHRNQVVAMARTYETAGGLSTLLGQEKTLRDRNLARFLEADQNLILVGVIPYNGVGNETAQLIGQWDGKKITDAEVGNTIGEAVAGLRSAPEKTFVSTPRFIKSSNEFAIVIAEPLRNPTLTGEVVVSIVSLEPVFNLVNVTSQSGNLDNKSLLKSGSRVVFLVNKQGQVLVHPDRAMVYALTDLSNWSIVGKWKDNILGQNITAPLAEPFELTIDKEHFSMLGSCTTARIAPDVPLGVFAVINEKTAYSSVSTMIWQAVTVSVITLIVAAAVGWIMAYRITSPIAALANGARAIAGGDFSKRLNLRTNSEIGQLAEDFNSMGEQVQRYINDLKFAANENRQLFLGTVRALAEAIDGKDPYTRGHSERVMLYSVLMAQHMGLNEDEVEDIRIAAILHDVGKIGIEDRILKKPAALTEEEYAVMKGHPQKGAIIMSQIPQMKKYVPGMYYHHECIDGRGYPLGLKGDQIPMMARIISVADTFDAMTTNRPYQRAMTTDVAVQKIWAFSGTRYDPKVVQALENALKAGKLDEVIHGYHESYAAGKA
jgi:HD-GYP domain-containing protein (c-di-GMP phosphodiesterase class II)